MSSVSENRHASLLCRDGSQAALAATLLVSTTDGARYLSYAFTVNPAASGVAIETEISSDLFNWENTTEADGVVIVDDGQVISLQLSKPIEEDPRRFVRMRFTVADEK